jgi:chromosome partitioning protein
VIGNFDRRGTDDVQTILIANPKGGSGKTTVATNVAGFIAGKRQRVVLADEDPQQSATQWLARRPALFPTVHAMPAERRQVREIDPHWVVVDSPAGLHGERLRDEIRRADVMLVPITPSAFDMAATARFLAQIAEYKAVKGGELAVALVANRVDSRTHSAAELDAFLESGPFPVVAHLRDTQVYVGCARDGASVFDLPRSRAEADWEQWRPLTRWLARQARAAAA